MDMISLLMNATQGGANLHPSAKIHPGAKIHLGANTAHEHGFRCFTWEKVKTMDFFLTFAV